MKFEKTTVCGVDKWVVVEPCSAVLYLREGTQREGEEAVKQVVGVLSAVEGFRDFQLGRLRGDGELRVYGNRALDPKKMFPAQKRLGHVLLGLLGRSEQSEETVPCVPRVVLRRSLADRTDKSTLISISHKTIDAQAKESIDRGLAIDEAWEVMAKEYSKPDTPKELLISSPKYGPPSREIYGSGEFTITIKELQQLERSIRVATSIVLPRKFYARLAQLTTGTLEAQRYFDLRRSIPLEHLGCMDLQDRQRSDLLKTWADRELNALHQKEVSSVKKTTLMADVDGGKRSLDANTLELINDYNYSIDNYRVVARNARIKIDRLQDAELARKDNEISEAIREFVDEVRTAPSTFGFSDGSEHSSLKKSLTELCTDVCISQKGYFFVDGKRNAPNQITGKTRQPVVFLSSPGLDFCDPSTTILEAKKYFKKLDTHDGQPKWRGFLKGAFDDLLQRVARLYRVIYRSCQGHNVCNPSMLAMGLGVFLENIHNDDKEKVAEAYFKAQFQLLCEQDWGFHNYFINPVRYRAVGIRVLEEELARGRHPHCNIIMHDRDVKFLATEMAKSDPSRPGSFQGPAMLNPSDCASIFLGLMGYFWEWGRQECYVGEEDFCCTGTGLLALHTITNVYGDSSRHFQDEQSSKPEPPRITVASQVPKTLAHFTELCKNFASHDTRPEERARFRKSIVTALESGYLDKTPNLMHEGRQVLVTLTAGPDDDAHLVDMVTSKLGVDIAGVVADGTTTPLHNAAYYGHLDTMVYLIQKLHPFTISERHETVYDMALDDTVKPTIRAAACCKLMRAIEGKKLHPMLLCSERVDKVNIVSDSTQVSGWSFLHWAAALGNEKLLVAAKNGKASCNLDMQDEDGWTPLYWIIARQSSSMLQSYLLPTKAQDCASVKLSFSDADLRGRYMLSGTWVADGVELSITENVDHYAGNGSELYTGVFKQHTGRATVLDLDIEVSAKRGPKHAMKMIAGSVARRVGASTLWDFKWNERDMVLTVDNGQTTYILKKSAPSTTRSADVDYTTAVHVCCDLGLDAMAAKLIAHDASLLNVRSPVTGLKPFITALLNVGSYHPLKPEAENIDLISELLMRSDDLKETKKEIRTRCVLTLRESISHPLVTTEKGWFLRVIDRSEPTAAHIVKMLCQYDDTRQVARSLMLFALHNACACLGPKDDVGDPENGDPSLVTRVLAFLVTLQETVPDLAWGLDTFEALITADCPTEADITSAEQILDTVFWTSRYLIGKSFGRLIAAVPGMEQLYHDGVNKKQFVIQNLRAVLNSADLPSYPTHEGQRIIEHAVALHATYKSQNRGLDADHLAYALLMLLQLHCNGPQSALSITVMHQRVSVLEMLLKQSVNLISATFKNLLKEAISTRRWAAVDILLPYAKRNKPEGVYLFDHLPSAKLEVGKEVSYPVAPSLRELELCSDHDLVHPRTFASVLRCHSSWLRSRHTAPKGITVRWSDAWKKFTVMKMATEEENTEGVMKWLREVLSEPKSEDMGVRISDAKGKNVQLVYDDVWDGGVYTVFFAAPIPWKEINIIGPKETKVVRIYRNEYVQGVKEIIKRRFLLPPTTDIALLDKNGEPTEMAYNHVTEGEKYTMSITGVDQPTWTEVLSGTIHSGEEKVAVIQYLLGTGSVNLNDFFSNPGNRRCFPYFDFGYENPRAGEVFLVICRLLHSEKSEERLLNDGFTINGINFTPEDTESLKYPLHSLMLRAHEGTGGAPTHGQHEKLRKRVTDLTTDVVTFINQVLKGAEGPGVSNIVRDYVKSLPCSVYAGCSVLKVAGVSGHFDLMLYKDMFPIELAVRLFSVEVLKSIFGNGSGLEEKVLRCSPSDQDNSDAVISCFNDHWFPDNNEWYGVDGVTSLRVPRLTKRPLLHQALDMLSFPKPTRYMAEQSHLLNSFLTRYPHVISQANRYVNIQDKTLSEEVGIPWFPPGSEHITKWAADLSLTHEEKRRKEIIEVLLESIVVRDTFRHRMKREACDRLEVLANDSAFPVVFSKDYDRCGLFKTVSLNTTSTGVTVKIVEEGCKPTVLRGLAPGTTVGDVKRYLDGDRWLSYADGTRALDETTIGASKIAVFHVNVTQHKGVWRDGDSAVYCNNGEFPREARCYHTELVIESDHWSCCGSRLKDSPCTVVDPAKAQSAGDATSPDEEDEKDDNWKCQLSEFGLGKLFQRAPWVLQGPVRRTVLRALQNYPMLSVQKLNQALSASFSPILIERRHQWRRSFRVLKWRHDDEDDPTTAPPNHPNPQPATVRQEPPGEQQLLIDSGLSLSHWACLLADTELLKLAINTLELPLSDSPRTMEPALTFCLKYTCLHYAAYAAATDVIEVICEWKTSTDIQGSDLLNFQVPCACHPSDGWPRAKFHKKDRHHRGKDWVKAKDEPGSRYCSWCLQKLRDESGDHDVENSCERCAGLSRAVGTVKQMNFEAGSGVGGVAVQPLLENWKNNIAAVVNLGNCEGGGGLVYKRAMNPPTAGDTPLIVASQFCHLAACRRMANTYKADIGLRNHEGYDAHDVAVLLQHRYEMQPLQAKAQADDDDYGTSQRVAEHERNSSKLLEKNVEMYNTKEPVQEKLFHFALVYFVKSLFHIFSFALVVTMLSWLTVQDGKKFFAKSSLGTVINTEEWNTVGLTIDGSEQSFRSFREDLSATLELEDFNAWFLGPFPLKVFDENPYGMFQLVGSVLVSKQDVQLEDCLKFSSGDFLGQNDAYKVNYDGTTQCGRMYSSGNLNNSEAWGKWSVPRPTFQSRFSWTTYKLGVGSHVEVHPKLSDYQDVLSKIANVDEIGDEEKAFLNHNTRFVATHFTFYNSYIDVFVVCNIYFEIFAQGAIQPTSRYRAVRVNTYQTTSDIFRAALEFVFCVFLVVQTVSQLINLCVMIEYILKEYRRDVKGKKNVCARILALRVVLWDAVSLYVRNWLILDLVMLIMQYVLFAKTVQVIGLQASLSSEKELLDGSGGRFYDEFIPLAAMVKEQEGVFGWIVLLAWIKCLKSLARLPSYGPIVNALISTMTDRNLFVFLFVFLWVLLSFYLAMLTAFSTSVTAFRLPAPAAMTLFKMVLGDTEHIEEMEEESSWVGPVFFVLVVVFCQLVLLNLIVAVLQEIYVTAINNAHAAWSSDIVSIYRYTLTSVVQPSSVSHTVLQYLRNHRVLDFKEKHLKRPDGDEGPTWVVVPHMEDDEEHEGDELTMLRNQIDMLREEVKQLLPPRGE